MYDTTQSICPECLLPIDAHLVEREDALYIIKECAEHGHYEAVHPLGSPFIYHAMKTLFANSSQCSGSRGLLINITSDCNQSCSFCYAQTNNYHEKELSLDEILTMVSRFKGEYIYLAGGEPTLRDDLSAIIYEIAQRGYKVILLTNGKKLAQQGYALRLKKSGLSLVILQFDTFDEKQCELLRGERLVSTKLQAIENLKRASIPIFLFVLLVKDVNTDQISSIIHFAAQRSEYIKIVNFQPVWSVGRVGVYEQMNISDIFAAVTQSSNLTIADFIADTTFIFYVSEILRKLQHKIHRAYPMCELRCGMVTIGTEVMSLGRLFNIEKAIKHLRALNDILNKHNRFKRVHFLLTVPYWFIITEIIRRRKLHKTFFALFKNGVQMIFKKNKRLCLSDIKIFSLIVGTFHTAYNADLSVMKTCNLNSHLADGQFKPFCLRQIVTMRQHQS
ncbi:MAG: radical SAM protein [Candidatus Omnitrophica bacterium]|nr:radical SAM protein [Candidatus Omnitrophota bacterium]